VFLARGGYNGLNIVIVPVVLPDAANITSRPDRRPVADSAEDHLGEVIRPVTGTEMDKVLNTALAIERGTDTHIGHEHYVRFR
jgi:hypothetical protein